VAASGTDDSKHVIRDIAGILGSAAILLAALLLMAVIPTPGNSFWDAALRWITVPAWVWVIAGLGYVSWLTRTLHDISKRQKEILQLLRDRRAGEDRRREEVK
jgi:heme exporter protein D